MELYNFFTETVSMDKKDDIYSYYFELKDSCLSIELVTFNGISKEPKYTIIGQIYGDDTNAGDLELLSTFINIKYYWFNANSPKINNLI